MPEILRELRSLLFHEIGTMKTNVWKRCEFSTNSKWLKDNAKIQNAFIILNGLKKESDPKD